MGGTSTDVSLCEGKIGVTHEAEIDGLPVGIPIIDIHTVGAGGGSIAQIDAGGALKVGPASAGAEPGPICYGKGGEQLTVTDANVLLGRLPPRFFLGGSVPLAVDRVAPMMQRLPWTSSWSSPEALAQGVIDVVNNNMEHAIRLISVERGHDPRDFALVCFGGAGGLHAAELARALAIPRVVVPPYPGALSALGLLQSDVRRDYSRSVLIDAGGADAVIRTELETLHCIGLKEMREEGFEETVVQSIDSVDLRYRGQSYELNVPFTGDFAANFHKMHERRYGHCDITRTVELVNVRATMIGSARKIELQRMTKTQATVRPLESVEAWFEGLAHPTAVYERSALSYGDEVKGPAIIGEYSATTLVPPDFRCEVDMFGNLILSEL
jgi:N-methylhydantoinase A